MSSQTITVANSGSWLPASPVEGAARFAALTVPWWIAGGWALDLFAGNQGRPHKDLDIGILRKDAPRVLESLAGWEVFEAKGGVLTRLRGGMQPRADVFSLWCRPASGEHWVLELMLDEADEGNWFYRRQPKIQRSLAHAIRRNAQGIPYLAPEIQLLYKSHRVRSEDQADFERIAPKLEPPARTWLVDCLHVIDPSHPWLLALDS